MPVVWSEAQRDHDPRDEIWLGHRRPANEVEARCDALLDACREVGARFVQPEVHGMLPVIAVHHRPFVEFLEHIWDDWKEAGLAGDSEERVVPGFFALPQVVGIDPVRQVEVPASVAARAGRFCMDTTTLIGPGTYAAARAAVDVALTATDLVLDGAHAAYALCRPPGHHAGRELYGGSCFLNNAAIAAQAIRNRGKERVAILDLDAHHGNGTQQIFYEREDVFYVSVHVDPAAGYFPYYTGHATETGVRDGRRHTLNVPLPPGTGDDHWLEAVSFAVDTVAAFEPDVTVVSLGVDGAETEPDGPFAVTKSGFAFAGRMLGPLAHTVFVQEGGRDLEHLGELTVTLLHAYEEARR